MLSAPDHRDIKLWAIIPVMLENGNDLHRRRHALMP
jgi:hypothetical protein